METLARELSEMIGLAIAQVPDNLNYRQAREKRIGVFCPYVTCDMRATRTNCSLTGKNGYASCGEYNAVQVERELFQMLNYYLPYLDRKYKEVIESSPLSPKTKEFLKRNI